jgi:hypothetical protein
MPSAVDVLVRLRTATSNGLIDLHVALRNLENDATAGDRALKNFRGSLLGLGTSAVPLAAGLAATLGPLVAQLGAAGVAAGAFGAALGPQVSQMQDAAKAQDTYTKAVTKYGATSKQATQAQQEYLAQLAGMPPATRTAAAALALLTDSYKQWSNSLAGDTMPVFTKGIGILESQLPRLTPMVKDASTQFQRLENVLAGGLGSGRMNELSQEFTNFADNSLRKTTDEVIHLTRVLSQGDFNSGPLHDLLDYARKNAPAAQETLRNLVEALAHVGQAAAEAGPGMLTIVNALAKLVDAIPATVLTRLIQLYTALRLFRTAAAGVDVTTTALGNLTRQMGTMTRASAAAGGGLAGVRAAVASLSTGTKVAGAVVVIAGLALVLKHFSDAGKQAKISADEMTTSLKGIASGDAAAASRTIEQLTKDGNNLHLSLTQRLKSNDSVWDIITNSGSKASAAKKDYEELGKALADMAQAGESDQAAAALERLNKAGVNVPTKYLKDYNSALADQAFENQLAAQSMGIFGAQAQQVQKQLDAQKQAAQGLQQAILDLNDANRAGLDAESDYQQAIDDATGAIKGHEHALSTVNGALNLNGQKARDAYGYLSKLAAATEASSMATFQQTGSQDAANRKLIEGNAQLVKIAQAMGLSSQDAHKFADQLDNIKDPKIQLTLNKDQMEANLAAAKKHLASFPKTAKTTASFAYQQAKAQVDTWQRYVDRLHGKTVNVMINGVLAGVNASQYYQAGPHKATGGIVGAASGGPRSRLTLVGEQGPELVDLAAGSRVHSNNASRQMLAGGGSSPQPMFITLMIGDTVLGELSIDPLRKAIRSRGGNVQAVLGQRGAA